MKNQVSDGKTIQLKSEDSANVGKVSGDVVVVGNMFAVAASNNPAATGDTFAGAIDGVFSLPKLSGEGIAQGKRVYWNGSGLGATPTGLGPVGTTTKIALSGDTTVEVAINRALPPIVLTGTLD
jgi:predicted RecA/RadA family phage recombinase